MINRIFRINGCCDAELDHLEDQLRDIITTLNDRVRRNVASDCDRKVLKMLRKRLEKLHREEKEAHNG